MMRNGEEERTNVATGLLTRKRLVRNTLWQLFGGVAPLLAGLLAIPVLVGELGKARFGVLALAWLLVGYFSLFDLGTGRALTKLVAEKLGARKADEIPDLVWTALVLMAAMGAVGAVALIAISPWLVQDVLRIPSAIQEEAQTAFYILGATIPVVVMSIGAQSVLAAHQRFGLVNAVRVPLGLATFLGPLAVLPFSTSLVPIVAALGVGRFMAWMANVALCIRVVPELRHKLRLQRRTIRTLTSFGGWMTVSNIIGPVMVSIDRFVIGATISMTAVAYYATPYEAVTRLWVMPAALMGVLFPAMSTSLAFDRTRAEELFDRAIRYIFIAVFPIVLLIVTLARQGLSLWLGQDFAENSTTVLQVLALGVLVNSLASVPFGLVQAEGRPDLTAKLHLAELPLYLLVLWVLLEMLGIVGAALAWTLRLAVDAFALFVISGRVMSRNPRMTVWLTIGALTTGILVVGAQLPTVTAKSVFLVIAEFGFLAVSWHWLLTEPDRQLIRGFMRRIGPSTWSNASDDRG